MSKSSNTKILSYKKIVEKSFFLKYLGIANKAGIYALVNTRHKRIYIGSSKYILSDAGRVISDLYGPMKCPYKDMKNDRRSLSFMFLEETKHLLIDKWKHMDEYKKMGYTIYNDVSLPEYVVYKYYNLSSGFIEIRLRSKGKRIYIVETMKTDEEADSYLQANTVYTLLKKVRKV